MIHPEVMLMNSPARIKKETFKLKKKVLSSTFMFCKSTGNNHINNFRGFVWDKNMHKPGHITKKNKQV